MSIFKSSVTGDITQVFGPVHDAFLTRPDQELVFDDRDATSDPTTQAGPVAPEPPAETPAPSDSSGGKPAVSKSTKSDAAGVGNPKE